jgi:hypothetical protein
VFPGGLVGKEAQNFYDSALINFGIISDRRARRRRDAIGGLFRKLRFRARSFRLVFCLCRVLNQLKCLFLRTFGMFDFNV